MGCQEISSIWGEYVFFGTSKRLIYSWIWKVGLFRITLRWDGGYALVLDGLNKTPFSFFDFADEMKLFFFFLLLLLQKESWRTVLTLAYQSLGVVYGDLSTSPLYVYKSTFAEDIEHSQTNEEIYGVLSFVFWTLTLVPLIKYVFIVLLADDNGEGGTFALYSLLCRHARLSSLPNCQLADEELSSYKKDISFPDPTSFGSRLKSTLEKHRVLQSFLLILALIGACMVIGDGILTPAISGKALLFFCLNLYSFFFLVDWLLLLSSFVQFFLLFPV